jgi:hypothetical protein
VREKYTLIIIDLRCPRDVALDRLDTMRTGTDHPGCRFGTGIWIDSCFSGSGEPTLHQIDGTLLEADENGLGLETKAGPERFSYEQVRQSRVLLPF